MKKYRRFKIVSIISLVVVALGAAYTIWHSKLIVYGEQYSAAQNVSDVVTVNTLTSFSTQEIYTGIHDIRPSILDYAKLSDFTYKQSITQNESPIQGDDWRVYETREGERYYIGVIYINDRTKQVVLAHRGTHSLKGGIEDLIGVVAKHITKHQGAAYLFTKKAVSLANYKNYHLSITGHSLGAFLAELSVYYCHSDFYYPYVSAVTFESPGSKDFIEMNLQPQLTSHVIDLTSLDIISYVIYPNVINTWDRHIGSLYALRNSGSKNKGQYSLREAHSMSRIIKIISDGKIKWYYMADWPLKKNLSQYIQDSRSRGRGDSNHFDSHFRAHYKPIVQLSDNAVLPMRHFSTQLQDFLIKLLNKHKRVAMISRNSEERIISNYQAQGLSDELINVLLNYRIRNYQSMSILETHTPSKSTDEFRIMLSDLLVQFPNGAETLLNEEFSNPYTNIGEVNNNVKTSHTLNVKSPVFLKENSETLFLNFPPRNYNFTGREEALKIIQQQLDTQKFGVITQTISGSGGIGKTQLATEYAYRAIEDKLYQVILWISADTSESINQTYREFAEKLELNMHESHPHIIQTQVHRKLEKKYRDLPILFILDNVASHDDIQMYIEQLRKKWAVSSKLKILITSRSQSWTIQPLILDIFTSKEAYEFVRRQLPNVNEDDINQLIKVLHYFPLALNQAVSYIKEHTNIGDYSKLYHSKQKFYLDKFAGDKSQYRQTLWQTWQISLKQLSDKANHILYISAYLHPDNIILDLFSQIPIEERVKAIGELRKYSLITMYKDGKSFKIHRLLQEVIRLTVAQTSKIQNFKQKIESRPQNKWLFLALELVEKASRNFNKLEPETWAYTQPWELHADYIIEYIESNKMPLTNNETFIKLLFQLGRFLIHTQDAQKAKSVWNYAQKLLKQDNKQKHYFKNMVEISKNLGKANEILGEYQQSLEHLEQAHSILMQLKNTTQTATEKADILEVKGSVNYGCGNYEQASENYESALVSMQDIENNEVKARILARLSFVQLEFGNYEQAEVILQKSRDYCDHGHDKLMFLQHYLSSQIDMYKYERYDKALKTLLSFSKEYADFIASKTTEQCGLNFAFHRIYEVLGNYTLASKHMNATIKSSLRWFSDRRFTTWQHYNLVQSWPNISKSNVHKAIDYFELALEIYQKVKGENSHQTARYHYLLGQAFEINNRLVEAKTQYQSALKIAQMTKPDYPSIRNGHERNIQAIKQRLDMIYISAK